MTNTAIRYVQYCTSVDIHFVLEDAEEACERLRLTMFD